MAGETRFRHSLRHAAQGRDTPCKSPIQAQVEGLPEKGESHLLIQL